MEEVPEAPENSGFVRYGFAAVFVAASLYSLKLGVRIGGVFIFGLCLYEAVLGRVPLTGWTNKTTGYLRGPLATAIVVAGMLFGLFLAVAPDTAIQLLAAVK